MAFLPINLFMLVLFVFGVVWGWEGETLRHVFALVCSTFIFPLIYLPLYSIVDDSVCCTIVATNGWLPTLFFQFFAYFWLALCFANWAHVMEADQRDMIGRTNRTLRGRRR
jgi:hypothetical protein